MTKLRIFIYMRYFIWSRVLRIWLVAGGNYIYFNY